MSAWLPRLGHDPVLHGGLLLLTGIALALISRAILKLGERRLRRSTVVSPRVSITRALFPATAALSWIALARSWWSVTAPLRAPSWPASLLSVALILAFSYWVARVVFVGARVIEARYDVTRTDNLSSRRVRTQVKFVEKLAYVLVVFAALCGSLFVFEAMRKVGTSLVASAGVASVIIGFAAQKSLSNLIAGVQIAFTQPIRLEDAVVVEGEWGWVEEINLTYVVLRLWDQRRLVLPITYFVEKPFQNWTRTSAQIVGAVMLEVSHAVPFAALERELLRLLEASPLWDRDRWVLQMVDAGERSVRLRALMTAVDSPTAWDLRCYVRRGLVEYMQMHHPEALPGLRIELEEPAKRERMASGF
jgi:small-conductance mechanosensitive channel